ncbi:MAG: hypothetical protein HOA16_13480, partial [Opitutae bacterium]|nr:hypothetical protein [Opitutae bacterium]
MKKIILFQFLLFIPFAMTADEGNDFFESKIRPVLVEHCYECHNSSGKAKAKL